MENYTDLPIAEIKSKAGAIFTAILLGVIGIGLLSSVRSIDAGTVGAVTRFGRVTGKTLNPGFNVVAPFIDSVMKYNTKKVTYETSPGPKQEDSQADYKDYPVDTNTSDGQPVDVSYTVRFSVDPSKAGWIAQNIGSEGDVVEKIVKAESRVWSRNIVRSYKSERIYSGEGSLQIQNEIFDKLQSTFSDNGLILDFFGIREIEFDKEYVAVIKNKQQAEVLIETEKNKAEQEKYRKEQRITQAEGYAQEQELQKQTLTPALLQKQWIEAWRAGGSQVPEIMTGDNGGMFLNLPR